VMDKPIFGHGSWAEDPKYIEMLGDISAETGYVDDEAGKNAENDYLIPSHSYLMGAWVFSGIIGAIFWAFIYYLVILGILKLLVFHPPLSPYFGYWLISSLWNILFSPFGQGARMDMAILLVMIGTLLEPPFIIESPSLDRSYSFRAHSSVFTKN
jgi:O-antigen ligase